MLVNHTTFRSESEQEHALDLLREASGDAEEVPPPTGPTNAPTTPDAPPPDPGPVAEPVPPQEQTPPPTSPEVAGAAPEQSNAFSEPGPSAPT